MNDIPMHEKIPDIGYVSFPNSAIGELKPVTSRIDAEEVTRELDADDPEVYGMITRLFDLHKEKGADIERITVARELVAYRRLLTRHFKDGEIKP
jgi:hypothetical protein